MKRFLHLLTALLLICLLLPGCKTVEAGAAQPAAVSTVPPEAHSTAGAPSTTAPETSAEPAIGAEPVTKLLLFDTACKKLTTSEQPRYDATVTAYSVRECVNAYEIGAADEVTVIGSSGYREAEPYEGFLDKYISLSAEHAPIVVGETQDADWAIWNVAAIRIGATAIVFFYQKADIPVPDLFAICGMAEASAYVFTCEDGYRQTVPAEEIPACALARIDGRFDARIPSLGEYTLYNVLSIEPAA